MLNIGTVQSCKIAFRKTEIVNSIQQVGFTHSILAANANDPFRKIKRTITVVFELNQ